MAEDPEAVEAIAKAIFDSQVAQLDAEISEVEFDFGEFSEFFIELERESDRAFAIISFSYIETICVELMSRHLITDIPGGRSGLFGVTGPLDTMHSRILVCRALNWISEMSFNNLTILRKIRNEFAHSHKKIGLDSGRILDYIKNIGNIEDHMLSKLTDSRSLNNREKLHVRSILICEFMIEELLASPIASRMGLPSNVASRRSFDQLPESFQRARRSAATAIVHLVRQEP
jgi:hypothetical protein